MCSLWIQPPLIHFHYYMWKAKRISLRIAHVVAGTNERRLYLQANSCTDSKKTDKRKVNNNKIIIARKEDFTVVKTFKPWTLVICLYTFLVTIECGIVLLTRVFSVSTLKNAYTIHQKKSLHSIVVNKMYTIMRSVHGSNVVSVDQLFSSHFF